VRNVFAPSESSGHVGEIFLRLAGRYNQGAGEGRVLLLFVDFQMREGVIKSRWNKQSSNQYFGEAIGRLFWGGRKGQRTRIRGSVPGRERAEDGLQNHCRMLSGRSINSGGTPNAREDMLCGLLNRPRNMRIATLAGMGGG
jgi:hypothetical protein